MNSDSLKLSSLIIAVLVAATLLLIGGCAPAPAPAPAPTPAPVPTAPSPMPEKEALVTPSPTPEKIEFAELKELERSIIIEAEGETLHYLEEKKWSEDKFPRLVEAEDRFSSNQIEKFKATYRVNAGDFDVEVDKKEKTTMLKCDVYVKLDGWYDFHWFLRVLGLDFIDDHFARSERELSWEGSLDGIKTTILLKFPFKINNCHAHVWQAK
jgi:hypothetical protein